MDKVIVTFFLFLAPTTANARCMDNPQLDFVKRVISESGLYCLTTKGYVDIRARVGKFGDDKAEFQIEVASSTEDTTQKFPGVCSIQSYDLICKVNKENYFHISLKKFVFGKVEDGWGRDYNKFGKIKVPWEKKEYNITCVTKYLSW